MIKTKTMLNHEYAGLILIDKTCHVQNLSFDEIRMKFSKWSFANQYQSTYLFFSKEYSLQIIKTSTLQLDLSSLMNYGRAYTN